MEEDMDFHWENDIPVLEEESYDPFEDFDPWAEEDEED